MTEQLEIGRIKKESGQRLAFHTTLRLGGLAREIAFPKTEKDLIELVSTADLHGEELLLLGEGSNLVISDLGFEGLAVKMSSITSEIRLLSPADLPFEKGKKILVEVDAGYKWDDFVHYACNSGWSGVEAMSGIPGLVGAAPVQNIGAYGQEISQVISEIDVYDRQVKRRFWISREKCEFSYRQSVFRSTSRYVILRVRFVLEKSDLASSISHSELKTALRSRGYDSAQNAPLRDVRDSVLALRAAKGMLVDPRDPDSQSAGSFFMNPLVERARAQIIQHILDVRAEAQGLKKETLPAFDQGDGEKLKLSAAFLIEKAGFYKGYRPDFAGGAIGISSKHALALVHYQSAPSEGSTSQLLQLARDIQDVVYSYFKVWLSIEPIVVGPIVPPLNQA